MPRSEFSRKSVMLVTCAHCSKEFDRGYNISAKRAANPQYCSKRCLNLSRRKGNEERLRDLRKRFFELVVRNGKEQCWGWSGRKHAAGYGVIDFERRPHIASRVSYMIFKGDPGELHVCHTCDNPECTNPDHLWLGTHQDNMDDAASKGRMGQPTEKVRRGSAVNTSRLSEMDVRYIRRSNLSGAALASKFGVSNTAIYKIRSRENWGWLDE